MSAQAWLQIILTLLAIFLVSIPLGRYMARIVMGRPTKLDRIFDPIDNVIYFLIGRRVAGQAMTWRTYTIHMLVTNLAMAIIIYLVLSFQNHLPLNQLNFPAVDPLLAFNTTISFVTNTNWQAYGGESTLSNFSQMGAITFAMFTSATTGFVVAMAWIRAFTVRNGGADLGNFYRDFIRFITRVLMPICFLVALFMIAQGAVQTFDASVTAHTLQGADQTIVVGLVGSPDGCDAFRCDTCAAPFEGLGHVTPAGQQRKSRGETSANLCGPDRGIAALSREGAAESYRRARVRPHRRAGDRWLSKPIRRGEG